MGWDERAEGERLFEADCGITAWFLRPFANMASTTETKNYKFNHSM